MYLSCFCAVNEIMMDITSLEAGRESRVILAMWQLILVFFELGVFVTYFNDDFTTTLYRIFYFVVGMISFSYGVGEILYRTLAPIREKSPLPPGETLEWPDLLEPIFFSVGGLILNLVTIGVFGVCGWTAKLDTKKDHIWDFEIYPAWIFQFLIVTVCLSISTISATLTTYISHSTVVDGLMSGVLGFVLIPIGFFTLINFSKKNEDIYRTPS